MKNTNEAMKILPTIKEPLYAENVTMIGDDNKGYISNRIIICANGFRSKEHDKFFTPHVAEMKWGDKNEKLVIAEYLVRKINRHDELEENLANMVFNFGASAKSVMQKKAIELARKLLTT